MRENASFQSREGEFARPGTEGVSSRCINAGIAICGRLMDVSTKDSRRLFDTNFWGVVYGSVEAARHLRQRKGDYAGAIIALLRRARGPPGGRTRSSSVPRRYARQGTPADHE